MSRNPNENLVEEEYIFEIHGEITVKAYSEEDAEHQLKELLDELVVEAKRSGELEIR